MLPSRIKYADEKVQKEFERLKEKNPELYKWINNAMDILEEDAHSGIQIQKRLIPYEYIKKYSVDNLWKYNLPKGWRLIYFIGHEEIVVICIILEWFDHKRYERRFRY
ncbi:hypothetical protein J4434_00265 [Candidatus Woesearchaeota archaeon]|nr:hypothetical protein [Candidatus Woesearchaeota archaeon]